ncbi:sugar ABC transporter substrate-binding protein [Subtercola sp. PAMC28395]|uniref:ABC transporter substrate-binding protein n=1 Tax=Subtercola sp. PAMC28395 TaxID=2846775 RepID=UPI001C0E62F5|nr:sugar ABC transporter substrate-binding protein [Subtercola sp. PAMC28395]QWT24162.1 sugar ABC transporter substrate-binding protein [Subtercola sp. PAMC28395]
MRHHKAVLRGTAIALTAFTAVALSGCSGQASSSSATYSPDNVKGQTVNILMIDTGSTKELKDVYVPKFEEQTGIKVNVELVPEAGMDAKLALSLGSGSNQYDVIEAGAKNLPTLVASQWISPLDSYLGDATATPASYTAGFQPSLLKSLENDGKSYTMPYQVGADLLYYNKSMFTAAGLDPANPPHTMTDIVAAAQKLNKPDQGQAGFVGRGTREGNENSFSWIMMWLLNGGRWLGDDGNAKYDVLTTPEAITTTEQYKKLMVDYGPAGSANYGYVEAQSAMQQGKAAMWIDGAPVGPPLEDPSASKIAGDVGYSALSGEGDNYIAGAVWGFSMVKGTKVDQAAWQLIKYLTDENVAVGQAVSGKSSPARSDVLENPDVQKAYNPEYLAAIKDAIGHANSVYSPVIPQGTQIRGALSLALSKILSDQSDIETSMNEANDEVKKIVQ